MGDKFLGTFMLLYNTDELAKLIDPLYTDVEGGVNLVIFARTYSSTKWSYQEPTFEAVIYQRSSDGK